MRTTLNMRGRLSKSVGFVPAPTLAVAIFVLILIVTASVVFEDDPSAKVLAFFDASHRRRDLEFFVVFLMGGAFGMLCSAIGQSGWEESVSCFWLSAKRTGLTLGIIAFTGLTALIWLGSAWVSEPAKSTGRGYILLHDPGGLFAVFMGLVTIVGFAFTLHDLREIRRRITTFPDLVDRLTNMLKKLKSDDVVRFLAYTPALGYIALEDREFNQFYRAVHDIGVGRDKPRVDMVCLSKKDLSEWHDLFIGRRTRRKKLESPASDSPTPQKPAKAGQVDRNTADHATKDGERILSSISDEATRSKDDCRVTRLPFEFLPGYYFFVSSDRAIIVAPLQLPFPKGAPKSAQLSRDTVQMLGFETNDSAIIRDLMELHDSYKKLPSSYVAEHSEEIAGDAFTSWCQTSSPKCQAAIDDLLKQFNVAAGIVPPAKDVEEENIRLGDYGKYLKDKLPKTKLEVTLRVSLKEEAPDHA